MIRWFVLLLFGWHQSGDWWYITNVKGKITPFNSSKELKAGDSIRLSDKLIYSTAMDRLVVLHPSKGRFVIKDKMAASRNTLSSRVLVTVSENFIPAGKVNLTASRSRSIQTNDEVSAYIRSSSIRDSFRVVLADSFFIPVQIKALADSAHFFYLQFREGDFIENVKIWSRATAQEKNTWRLYIMPYVLPKQLPVKSTQYMTAALYYFDGNNNESSLLGNLYLQVVSSPGSRDELNAVRTVLERKYRGNPRADYLLQQEIQQYYLQAYE